MGKGTIPRNRRPAEPNPNKSGNSGREKKKVEEKKGLGWKQWALVICVVLPSWYFAVRFFYNNRTTYPAKLQRAQCLEGEANPPFFVPCKDRESHNKQLLRYFIDEANKNLTPESIAQATAGYLLALAMRTRDKELGGTLYEFIMTAQTTIECTQLIDVDAVDFQKETPRSICAAANYLDGNIRDHSQALYDFNLYNDMTFLMVIYGSEFNDVALRYTTEVQLATKAGKRVTSPFYAGYVESFYSMSPRPEYAVLMNLMGKRRNDVEDEREGTYLLAEELLSAFTTMRRCNPPEGITWMEYYARAAFKRAAYEGVEDGCGWATEFVSIFEKAMRLGRDVVFRFKKIAGKI